MGMTVDDKRDDLMINWKMTVDDKWGMTVNDKFEDDCG
jgi:hypothetical protein